jgi:methylmalonyl-CoA/ethylmalonyl-CoA epimerase
MLKVKHIDHVAIAVADLDHAGGALTQLFGLDPGARETVAAQKTDVFFLHAQGGETAIELICPSLSADPLGNPGLERFLAKRGPGLHHVCFEVDDLGAALAALRAAGIALVDDAPRPGARGHLVAFIHPKATGGVLFELCQKARRADGLRPEAPPAGGEGTL